MNNMNIIKEVKQTEIMVEPIIERRITSSSKDYKQLNAFMKRVFPKDELMPIWAIILLTKMKNHKFSAFYHKRLNKYLFLGILYVIETKNSIFVFYLATNDSMHSKGYGSKLLKILFEKYKNQNKPIVLFIEAIDTTAPNYTQRIKRLSFYKKNGFVDTNIKVGTNKPLFQVLSNDKYFSKKQCKRLLKFTPIKIF